VGEAGSAASGLLGAALAAPLSSSSEGTCKISVLLDFDTRATAMGGHGGQISVEKVKRNE
jgi:hypothetical protein